jgi:tungstate transport system substrate-binding protein
MTLSGMGGAFVKRATRAAALVAVLLFAAAASACSSSSDKPERIIVGTTHTLEDSGLLDSIAARFRATYPSEQLDLVIAGSGEVIEMGRLGDVDALLTHAPADEKALVAAGYGLARHPVARNEFLIVGPATDPARVRDATGAADAFARIRKSAQDFVSRGDDSGTNKKERAIWTAAALEPDSSHYIDAGAGMADALRIADQRNAYILTDVATFLTLQHTLHLQDLYHGDPLLRNDYSVIVITRARNPDGAKKFSDWIRGDAAQKMIAAFGKAQFGRALFYPAALH